MHAMTFKEFAEVVNYIKDKRSAISCEAGFPRIKYIDPVLDMRTNTVFHLRLRGFGSEQEFGTVNEWREVYGSMFDHVMQWLNTKI